MKKTLLILLAFIVVLAVLFGLAQLKERLMPTESLTVEEYVQQQSLLSNWENDLDLASATRIVMDGDSISVSGQGAAVSGSDVTIAYPGTYILSGGLHDGQVIVNCDHDGTVYLVLDSVQIHCYDGPGIFVQQAKDTVLYLPEGSQSYVSDGTAYATVYAADGTVDEDQPAAAIYSRDDLHIDGTGTLNVTGSYNDAIHCKDDLQFEGGTVNLAAVSDGAKGTESLRLEGGTLNVQAGADGIQSTKGYIEVSAGSANIACGGDGAAALTELTVSGGTLNILTAEGYEHYGDIAISEISAKALKADEIRISGGTLTLDAADDGIHAETQLVVEGGLCTVYSGDDGLSAGGAIRILGGEVAVEQSYEGLEALNVAVSGGTVRVYADNNGLASTLGLLDEGLTALDCAVSVSGGILEVTAAQALKCDGTFTLSDGLVFLHGLSLEDEAMEAGLGSTVAGGTLLVTGTINAAEPVTMEAGFGSVLYRMASPVQGGTTLEVRDENGGLCFSYTPGNNYGAFLVAYNGILPGESYQLSAGGQSATVVVEQAAAETAGSGDMTASGNMPAA